MPPNAIFFARRFFTLYKWKSSNVRPLLCITFPQGFQISKIFGHPTLGSGCKKTFKRYLNKWTYRQTHAHTDRQTYGQIDLAKASAASWMTERAGPYEDADLTMSIPLREQSKTLSTHLPQMHFFLSLLFTAISRPGGYEVCRLSSNMPKSQKSRKLLPDNFCHFLVIPCQNKEKKGQRQKNYIFIKKYERI